MTNYLGLVSQGLGTDYLGQPGGGGGGGGGDFLPLAGGTMTGEIGNLRSSDTQVHIGRDTGLTTQGIQSVAVGFHAGETTQGDYSVAVGSRAGLLNQHPSSVIINGSSSIQNSTDSNQIIIRGGLAAFQLDSANLKAGGFLNCTPTFTQLGSASATSLYSNSDNVCDVGQVAKRYKNAYFAGDLECQNIQTSSGIIYPLSGAVEVFGGLYAGAGDRPAVTGGYTQIFPVTVSNTTAPVSLINIAGAKGTPVLLANTMRVGSTSKIYCSGLIDTNGNNELFTLQIISGATILFDFPLQAESNLTAGSGWQIEATSLVTATGVTGTIITTAVFTAGNDGAQAIVRTRTQTSVIDTTVSNVFNLVVTWNQALPTNSITSQIVHTFNVYHPPS